MQNELKGRTAWVVGAGGTQSSPDGKTSSFGTYCSATGGKLGGLPSDSWRLEGGRPGEGVGSGGILLSGGWGSEPTIVMPNTIVGGSGDGGSSFWGGGIRSGNGGIAGRGSGDAAPGAGGGGCDVNERGPGRPGIVFIQY